MEEGCFFRKSLLRLPAEYYTPIEVKGTSMGEGINNVVDGSESAETEGPTLSRSGCWMEPPS
jgi:hypothetical protein